MPKFLVALLLFLSVLGPCFGTEYLDDSIYSNSSKEVQKVQQLLKTLFEDPERNCYDRDIMQKNFELFLQDISVLKLDPENDDKACVEISNCKDIEQNIIFLSGLMNLMKSPQGNHSIRWKLHDYNGPMATDYYSIISPRSTLYIDISLAEYDNKDYVTPVAVYKDDIMPYSSYSIISNSIFYMEMEETFLFLDDFVTRHTVTFADIPQNSDEYIKYAKLYATGVIAGYEDHTFRRNQFVSRGEFVTILYRYKYSSGVLQDQEHSFFSDVPVDSYYHPYINKAHSEKWINGYDDGSFRPDDPISKQDIYLIVARLTELIANADQAIFKPKLDIAGVSPYAYNAVNALLLTKCVEAESDYTQYATRSDTVDVLYHVTYLRRAVRDYNIPCKTLIMYPSSIQLPYQSDDACSLIPFTLGAPEYYMFQYNIGPRKPTTAISKTEIDNNYTLDLKPYIEKYIPHLSQALSQEFAEDSGSIYWLPIKIGESSLYFSIYKYTPQGHIKASLNWYKTNILESDD